MYTIKQIFGHLLNGFLNLAALFDRSVESLVRELESDNEKADKAKK